MKKLASSAEMEVGKVYIIADIASQGGFKLPSKRTILVEGLKPFAYVNLYPEHGDPRTDDLRDLSPTYCYRPEPFNVRFYDIFEAEDESEWVKYSAKVRSLGEGLEKGILRLEMIVIHPVRARESPFVTVHDENDQLQGVYTRFQVENLTPLPDLYDVCVWWNTWEEVHADFDRYDVNARR